jgi:hypothetical protein
MLDQIAVVVGGRQCPGHALGFDGGTRRARPRPKVFQIFSDRMKLSRVAQTRL